MLPSSPSGQLELTDGMASFCSIQPDLPLRLKKNLPLTKYDRQTFYEAEAEKGYSDYPFAPENVAELA